MKFSGRLVSPRVNKSSYQAALAQFLEESIKEGAREWLQATAVSIVPVWSGASVSTFFKLAQDVGFGLSAGHVPTAPDRRLEGRQQGDGGFSVSKTKASFFYATTLEHLIHNEFSPPPGPGQFGTLQNPGPYNFRLAGIATFRRFSSELPLPDPTRYFKRVTLRV